MLGARRHPGRQGREIIERLVVVLEVWHRDRVLTVERGLPSPGVPCPGEPFGAQQIADRLLSLGRESGWLCRIREGGVTSCRWAIGTRLIGGLHRIDGIKIRCEIAVIGECGWTLQR